MSKINWNAESVQNLTETSEVFYKAGRSGSGITITFGETVKIIPAYLFYEGTSENSPLISTVDFGTAVTEIEASSFCNLKSLNSVTIPDSVTSVGTKAFYGCSNLETINWNANLSTALTESSSVFGSSDKLAVVNFGDSVTKIPSYLFAGTKIASVNIGKNVTSIGSNAFSNCAALNSVTIPEGVTSIGYYAFSGCSSVQTVNISSSVTLIESYAFFGLKGLKECNYSGTVNDWCNIYFENLSSNPLRYSESLSINGEKITELNITCAIVWPYAFYNCKSLDTITLSDEVETIGNLAFGDCTGVSSITIPDSVKNIGIRAFYNVPCLSCSEEMTASGSPWGALSVNGYQYENDADFEYSDYNKTTIVSCSKDIEGDLVIPESVTEISDYAFKDCTGIISVSIENEGITIGKSAFEGCSSLESVVIGSGEVTSESGEEDTESTCSFGSRAFADCGRLSYFEVNSYSIYIYEPESTNNLTRYPEQYAPQVFENSGFNSEGIEYVFGDKCTDIPFSMFNWKAHSLYELEKSISGNSIFSGLSDTLSDIYSSNNWNDLKNANVRSVYIGKNVLVITGGTFSCIDTTKEIHFASENLEWELLNGINESDVISGENITAYLEVNDDKALNLFKHNSSVTTLVLDCELTEVNYELLKNCSNIKKLVISGSVKKICAGAFADCASLETLEIGASVDTIEEGSFGAINPDIIVSEDNEHFVVVDESLYSKDMTRLIKVSKDTEEIVIPQAVDSDAFSGSTAIKKVTFADGVEVIPDNMFNGCESLTEVIIPDSVTKIGEGAFAGTKITDISIPNSVTEIGAEAFMNTDITEVVIPSSVKTIGASAFKNCSKVESIVINSGVEAIRTEAFADCGTNNIDTLNVPDTVITIGPDAFLGFKAIDFQGIAWGAPWGAGSVNGLVVENDVIKSVDKEYTGMIYIPNGVTRINDSQFSKCKMKGVVIPDTVTYIGKNAFYECRNLEYVNIPVNVTTLGDGAFYNCVKLTRLDYTARYAQWETTAFQSNGVFANAGTESTGLKVYYGSTVEHITPIFTKTLNYFLLILKPTNSNNIVSVEFENGVKIIDAYSFAGCKNLLNVDIPDSVTSIGKNAFYGVFNVNCKWASVGYIGARCVNAYVEGDIAYSDSSKTEIKACSYRSFVEITIPVSVKTIASDAFWRCHLKSVNYEGDISDWCGISFVNEYSNPYSKTNNVYINGEKLTGVVIPNGVTSIGNYAFYNCTGISSVSIPNSVTSIGNYAFYNCTGMKRMLVPNSVKTIGTDAFYNMYNIDYTGDAEGANWGARALNGFVKFVKSDDCTYFFVYADKTCKTLLACSTNAKGVVTIPDSVEYIADYAFKNCSGITSINIIVKDGTDPVLGNNVFSGCTKLTDIKYFNDEVFTDKNVIFGDNGARIIFVNKNYSGENGVYEIPEGVMIIEDNAFYNCENLKTITIPSSVISVGSHAFDGTASDSKKEITDEEGNTFTYIDGCLINVVQKSQSSEEGSEENSEENSEETSTLNCIIPDNIICIASGAFNSCDKITSVTIPSSVKGISHNAFDDCSSLSKLVADGVSLEYVGTNAFSGTSYYSNLTDGIKYIGNALIKADITAEGIVEIKEGTTCIAEEAFKNCADITEIKIPEAVKTIGAEAFCNCSSLESASIPAAVTYIGSNAFYGCNSLTAITVEEGNKNYKSVEGVLFSAEENPTLIKYPAEKADTEYKVPDGTKYIEEYAFAYCSKLKKISVPDSTEYTMSSFYRCDADRTKGEDLIKFNGVVLEQVTENMMIEYEEDKYKYTVPAGVTSILPGAFSAVKDKLNQVDLNGAIFISKGAFYECSSLTNIEGLENVVAIGEEAFYGCTALEGADLLSARIIGSKAFSGCDKLNAGNVTLSEFVHPAEDSFDFVIEIPQNSISGEKKVEYNGSIELTVDITDSENAIWLDADTGIKLGEGSSCTIQEITRDTSVIAVVLNGEEIVRETSPFIIEIDKETVPPAKVEITDKNKEPITNITVDFGNEIKLSAEIPEGVYVKWYEGEGESLSEISSTTVGNTSECIFTPTKNMKVTVIAYKSENVKSEPTTIDIYVYYPTKVEGKINFSDEEQENGKSVTISLDCDSSLLTKYCDIKWFDSDGNLMGEGTEHTFENPEESFKFSVKLYAKGTDTVVRDLGEYTVNVKEKEVVIIKNATLRSFSGDKTINYKEKARIIAYANDVPDGYILAIYDGAKQLKSVKPDSEGNASIEYVTENLTGNKTYTVKIVDSKGNVYKSDNGTAAESVINVKVKSDFITKLIAFFKSLFKLLAVIDIKP